MAFRQWGSKIVQRLARAWLVLVSATLLAVLALAQGLDPLSVVIGWGVLCLSTLLIGAAEEPEGDPVAVVIEEPVVRDRLPDIAAAYGALDMPVFVLNGDASVVCQNLAAEKAFGAITPGMHLSARLRSPGILDMVRETVVTDQPNQIEHSERHPSESVYIIRIAPIEPGTGDDGSDRHYALSFRDISELRRIDRMRSDFVANASHELRTPLASLRGFIETLQGPAKGDVSAHERFLGIMFEQATRMSRLVDDLLSLSRLELKSHIAPSQRVDLVPLVGHVRDSLLPLAQDLGIEIRMHLPQGRVEVTGDRDELVQVIENLMENACKYGQEGKIVDVHLRNEPSEPVELSVVDRGPGIPAEHVPRLTERFYRVSVADSRSKKGTGLGLAIVKHILTRHRARLIVKSELGKGTEFTVRF